MSSGVQFLTVVVLQLVVLVRGHDQNQIWEEEGRFLLLFCFFFFCSLQIWVPSVFIETERNYFQDFFCSIWSADLFRLVTAFVLYPWPLGFLWDLDLEQIFSILFLLCNTFFVLINWITLDGMLMIYYYCLFFFNSVLNQFTITINGVT